MNTRKDAILSGIIKEYIKTADPIGSTELVDKYNFDISPATIRNEMSELEKEGYIFQPYTSAGRIPTNKGYRYFVDSLMSRENLTAKERSLLNRRLKRLYKEYDLLLKDTARILADLSQNVALSSDEKDKKVYSSGISYALEQPEFSDLEQAYKIAKLFDSLDDYCNKFLSSKNKAVNIYIGNEGPFKKDLECSIIVSRYKLPSGEKGCLAILGPTRMKYEKNIPLIEYVSKLLGGGMLIVLFLINF